MLTSQNQDQIVRALRTGIEIKMGEIVDDGDRSYRVAMCTDGSGQEHIALVCLRQRSGHEDDEVYLHLDADLFAVWCAEMTPDEVFIIGANSALRRMANERVAGRSRVRPAPSTHEA
jgi:hypothetical protein